ncbi:CDP-glycerol glycerophosphotransferase family protein [Kitasatospora sp. NPDC059571]|uniref:CDP-glycerol glycerophosphotransferase family protein n=1 Tax=Kitasatospora sp. NPDC059571 TaxID=3346871 RepID=UPI00367A499F
MSAPAVSATDPAAHGADATEEPAAVFGLRSVRWTEEGLELTGFAFATDRNTGKVAAGLTSVFARRGSAHPVRLRARRLLLPEATDASGQSRFNHDRAGFTAVLDPKQLRSGGTWRDGVWRIGASVSAGLRRHSGPLAPHWCGSAEYPAVHWVDEDVRVVPYFAEQGLRLRVETVRARITSVTADQQGLQVAGRTRGPLPEGTAIRLQHRPSGTEVDASPVLADGAFTAELPFALLTAGGRGTEESESWDARFVLPDGTTLRAALDERGAPAAALHPLPDGDRHVLVKQLADGDLQVCVRHGGALVHGIAAEADGFRLSVHALMPGEGALELVLRHSNGTGEVRRTVDRASRLDLRVPACVTASDGTALPLRQGVWDMRLRPVGDASAERSLLLAPAAQEALPAVVVADGAKRIVLERRWHDTLILDSTPVIAAEERSAWAQEQLRTRGYPAARQLPLRDAVLYDVFSGRGYADSPKAVHAELVRRGAELEHLWVVDDAQAEAPPGARAVRAHSAEWYEAYATSRYVVGNTHFPDFLERRPGQVVVQTWHGSLLKRIAHDVENAWLADHGYLTALDRETPHWSVLVSPSAFATPILQRAFRYKGEVLESGYPRNDALAAGADAAAVRRRLGVPDGKRIVLYAPTWREDQQRANGDGYELGLQLDLAAARAELAADHVLLVRPHAHVREPLPGAGDGFLFDVGDYPDVQELLLAADVLVTDYSSIMFDFAITGRPVLFFTYDLEHYRDTLRGFYFDFEAEVPGPLLPTSGELVAALRDLAGPDTITPKYAEAYRRFRATHCALDDGRAAVRVVDRMLALG